MKLPKSLLLGVGIVGGMLLVPFSVMAATDSDTTTIDAVIASTISITTSSTVTLNVTPVSGGAQTSASDTVTVATNSSNGYTLELADSDADTDLENGVNAIPAHAGTQASPTVLANNTWGYRVDSEGGFSTGGAVESNVTSSTITYAGIPASGSEETIKTTATTTASDATTVWYAVKADTTNPNGTYTDTVTYTATTNN